MSTRKTLLAGAAIAATGAVFFSLGNFLAARQAAAATDAQFLALRAEMERMIRQTAERPSGTSGQSDPTATQEAARAALVQDVKRLLEAEMGLLPISLLRQRRDSFVELYSYDNRGSSNYGTAGYLGDGYFITVKHAVVALGETRGDAPDARRVDSIKLIYKGQSLKARVVDSGRAKVEVDPGDWAIIKVKEPVDLPPLRVDLGFGFEFADPIFRLGNDYSKGIILSTGYIGQRTANQLVTSLTDGHPGVSGGGVLDRDGDLVGIPIGRMQGDYRFSFILPLRSEMFRKVPHLKELAATTQP
jgi:hypothetical protein